MKKFEKFKLVDSDSVIGGKESAHWMRVESGGNTHWYLCNNDSGTCYYSHTESGMYA